MSYIPKDAVTQSFKSNKGVLTPNQLIELDNLNKLTKYGQLELIQTQTTSDGTTAVSFTDLSDYMVHLMVWSNLTATSAETNTTFRLSNDGGSSYIASDYQYGHYFQRPTSPLSLNSSGSNFMGFANNLFTGVSGNGYAYFYNLLDSTKYSFNTYHGISDSNTVESTIGGAYRPVTAEKHNAVQLTCNTDSFTAGGTVSLYGLRTYE